MAITKTKDPLEEYADPLMLMATQAAQSGAPGFPPELAMLLTRRLAKEMAAQEREEEEMRRLLEARSIAFKEEIAGRQRAQEYCPHRKEDGRSRIGGQRLSNGVVLFLCQYCGKEWRGQELPPGLQISLDFIGG
jgi:hypothetical protein